MFWANRLIAQCKLNDIAPRICLLQQIHGAIIYRGYQFKKISTVIMQESIQTPSGIYIMYHDTAYHDADHGYEEIL